MEQQLSDSSNAAAAWAMGEEQPDKLCNLQLALTVREKDRVISRLECQVEEIVSSFRLICKSDFLKSRHKVSSLLTFSLSFAEWMHDFL